ncbi:MAG: hypothetical protein K8R73_02170 [Clostridiales bacterium]|nr:hypothetical protein [Clostridiales bacterium]
MKITKIILLFILYCFLTSSNIFASDHDQTLNKEEQRLIRKAKHFKQIEDYQDYLQHYPNGVYAEEARRGLRGETKEQLEEKAKIDKLAKPLFDKVMKTNKYYSLFLERFPKSSYVDEVKRTHDMDLWEFTKTHNEIYLYEAYIKRSLSGIHVEEAKKIIGPTKIKELEAKVKPLSASDVDGNLILYKELLGLDPENIKYKKKVLHYQAIKNQPSYKYTSRIKERYDKFDDSTRYSMSLFGVVRGSGLRIGVSAYHSGKGLTSKNHIRYYINFENHSSDGWKYLKYCPLRFIVDGKVSNFGELDHDGHVGNGYVLEFMNASVQRTFLNKLAFAKEAEFKLGITIGTFSTEMKEGLQVFLHYLQK